MWPLKALYRRAGMNVAGDEMRLFFQRTLRIPNISHEHIMDELEHIVCGLSDTESVRDLYGMLQEMYEADQDIAESIQ